MRLTRNEIRAIVEALASRLAGPIDYDVDELTPKRKDYERALQKMRKRLA